jgi:hypothetical protein
VLEERRDHLLAYSVAVRPTEQGKGHARVLLEFADQRAAALGRTLIRLDANVRMEKKALSQNFAQFFGAIGPLDRFADADEIAQHAGPLGERVPALRVDPPGKKVGDPRVRIRVARRTDIRPHTAGRAVAAHHVKELMSREMRQLIKADQRNLCTLGPIRVGPDIASRGKDAAAQVPKVRMTLSWRGESRANSSL